MVYPENETNKKSKFGLLIILFVIFALVALGGLVVFLWSVNPILIFILIGIAVVLGIPVIVFLGFLIVCAAAGDDGWDRHQWTDWSNLPKIRDRWPDRDKL